MNPPFNNHLDPAKSETGNDGAANESPDAGEAFSAKPRRVWTPPSGARCASCGSADIAALPTYAVGSGVALRPYADDVLCRKCGQIAPPNYEGNRH